MKGSIEHFDQNWHRNEISTSSNPEINLMAMYKQGLIFMAIT